MDIKELHSFKLSDAVKFHSTLNPVLWRGQRLEPAVKKQLLVIAQDFLENLGINNLQVEDVRVSGSNAAFTYTPHSDLDLHILVDMTKLSNDAVYHELFNAKKTLYNDTHNITIRGVPVELYIQDSNQPVVSLGEYSVLHDKWIKIPSKRKAHFDQNATRAKFDKLAELIDVALKTEDIARITKALKIIKRYRQAGLDKGGEFSPENLAYKAIRSQGGITKLYALRDELHSKDLSIESMYASENKNQYKTDDFTNKLAKEFKQYSTTDEDYDPNGPPPGPESPPEFPAGTVKVDVSDVYDWYKLGQSISNLDSIDPKTLGKGPPQTVLTFGSEPEEHKYMAQLKKLGLTIHDIDPEGYHDVDESYQPPSLSVGDKILKGKFKNSPAEIKGFKKDKHNQPVLKTNKGEVQLFKPRISKLMPEGVAEARRNPEQNMRSGSGKYDLINYAEDINDKDNWAVSMTMEPKLGINPRAAVSEDTPKGIYFYPLQYFMQMADRDESLPWGDNLPYIQLFQYDRSGEMTKETKVNPAKLKQALSQYCSDEVMQQASEENEYDGTPYWYIYDCLSRLGKGDETNVIRWNKVLRDLGFTSVYDPGHGWIAYNEPTQGVVLDPRIIKQHKMFDNRNPTLEHRRYDMQGLADSIGWSSYYQREKQLQRVQINHSDEEKVRLAVAKSMLKSFLGKSSEEADEMGYDKALKAAADKVIQILKQDSNVSEGYENLSYIGNCTDDDVIEHIFGDATGFAQAVDEYGDEFTLDDLVVKYDPETDVHSFYYKEQGVAEDYTMQYAAEKTPAINPYGGLKDNQYRGSISEDFSNDMSTEDMIAYLKQHHDKNLHSDYVNHLTSTNSKFVLTNIPLTSIRTELAGLDRAKVEQYKNMDFTKAPPIVVGSDGNILDGYHRATVAKALNIPSIKAYIGIKNQQMSEASGYIPSEKEKNDPRYCMALTVDVHPDSIKKNAKAFYWLTDRAGIPPTANPSGKV